MPIITVKQENSNVVVHINTDLAHNCDGSELTGISFTWSTSHPYIADLLTHYIKKRIETAISETRREYYERGWKDAKAKKQKGDWFPGYL